jgi:hypothetical protein
MRFLMIVKASKESEAGVMPTEVERGHRSSDVLVAKSTTCTSSGCSWYSATRSWWPSASGQTSV